MPLPDSAAQWPPASVAATYAEIAKNDVWLTGNINGDATSPTAAGGVVNALRSRLGIGTAITGAVVNKLHVPVPASIARMSSTLLYGELFKVEFTDDEDSDDTENGAGIDTSVYEALTKRANELLDDANHGAFLEAGEYASAHGGCYMRVSWDKTVSPDKPFLTVMPADTAVPTFRFGRLVSVIFWTTLSPRGGQRYTLLENHEVGTIEFGLYESNAGGALGSRVPLTSHPDVAGLVGTVNEFSQIDTGSDMLTAVYLPNAKPNRRLRHDPIGNASGRSDYDQALDLFEMLDDTYTSWERDFRLGKTRIMVPKNMLKLGAPGSGAQFNSDQELFVEMGESVGAMNDAKGDFIKTFQPLLRDQEHQRTAQHLFERIYAATGYSAQSFGEEGDMAKTATEVSNREKSTLQTRAAKIVVARPVIVNLIAALLDVDHFVFPDKGVDRHGLLPVIDFPEAVGEDPGTLAGTLQTLTLAEAISTVEKVRRLNPDWDDAQIDEEVARIKEEYSLAGPMRNPVTRVPLATVADGSVAEVDPLDPETDAVAPAAKAPATPSGEVTKK